MSDMLLRINNYMSDMLIRIYNYMSCMLLRIYNYMSDIVISIIKCLILLHIYSYVNHITYYVWYYYYFYLNNYMPDFITYQYICLTSLRINNHIPNTSDCALYDSISANQSCLCELSNLLAQIIFLKIKSFFTLFSFNGNELIIKVTPFS